MNQKIGKQRSKSIYSLCVVLIMAICFLWLPISAKAIQRDVSTYQQLKDALTAATAGDIINIKADIQLEAQLEINKTITLRSDPAASRKYVLTSVDSSGARHFAVKTSTVVTFTVKDLVLDGAKKSGGITSSNLSTLNMDGVVVQNCFNDRYGVNAYNTNAGVAAALYVKGTISIEGCTFRENETAVMNTNNNPATATGRGAAINAQSPSILTINNSVFESNIANDQGGAIYASSSVLNISNTNFKSNTATGNQGGAMFLSIGNSNVDCTVTLNNCNFTNNSAPSGGAFSTYTAAGAGPTGVLTLNMTSGSLSGNKATGASGGGGAVRVVAYNGHASKFTFTDVSMHDNTAAQGGVIGLKCNNAVGSTTQITITDGAIYNNDALADHGGAIYDGDTDLTTIAIKGNTRIYNNTALLGDGGAIHVKNLENVSSEANVNFANNKARAGYFITSTADIATHVAQIKSSAFSAPFTYGYNNYDINYTAGTLLEYYNVIFDSQGGSAVPSLNNVLRGSLVTKPVNPTRNGYTFEGWYKEAACQNAWGFITDKVNSNPTVLYAKWALAIIPSPSPSPSPKPTVSPSPSPSVSPSISPEPTESESPEPSTVESIVPLPTESLPPETPAPSPLPSSSKPPLPKTREEWVQKNEETLKELEESGMPIISIVGLKIPLSGGKGALVWAVLNLLLMIAGLVLAVIMLLRGLRRNNVEKKDVQYNEQITEAESKKRKVRRGLWIAGAVVSLLSLLLFLLTEDTRRLMVLVDGWTIPTLLLFVGEIILYIWAFKKKKMKIEQETEDIQ